MTYAGSFTDDKISGSLEYDIGESLVMSDGARNGMELLMSGSGISYAGCPSSPVAKHAGVLLAGLKEKASLRWLFLVFWCPEEDSNLHTLRHTDLNRARLPIPPSGQCNLLKARNLIVKG